MDEEKKVDLGNVVDLVKDTTSVSNYECKLCKDGLPHMIVMMSKDGNVHVHAPFENKYMMSQFMESIIVEQNKFNSK